MAQLWPGGIEYSAYGAFPVTTDSVLLAGFARVRPRDALFEPCCGAGLISLLAAWREPGISVYALELDEDAARAAGENFAANGLRARLVCGDLRDKSSLPAAESCTLCLCNPPYFPEGSGAAARGPARAAARGEGMCRFSDVCAAAARSLRQGGRFAFVHRPERLAGLFADLAAARLEPKRLRLVQHRADSAPGLVLCEAVKLAAPGLKAEPALVLYGPDGEESAEFRRIYHREA